MTAVAVMLLGVLTFSESREVAVYPLVIGAVAIIASIVGALSVRTRTGNVEAALYKWSSRGVLSAAAFYPVTKWLMDDISFKAANLSNVPSVGCCGCRDRRGGHRRVVRDHRLHLDPL